MSNIYVLKLAYKTVLQQRIYCGLIIPNHINYHGNYIKNDVFFVTVDCNQVYHATCILQLQLLAFALSVLQKLQRMKLMLAAFEKHNRLMAEAVEMNGTH